MEQNDKKYEELIRVFHLTWDAFPGPARLIDKENHVLAVNHAAEAAGLTEGQICAKMGTPESHKDAERHSHYLHKQRRLTDRFRKKSVHGFR